MTRSDFEIAAKEETSEGIVITLIKSNMTDAEKEKVLNGSLSNTDDAFRVSFEAFMEGENQALEIEGVKKYSFYGVEYNYLDLFPFWQKYFVPDATKETVLKQYKLQVSEYKEGSIWWLYKFESDVNGNQKRWLLRKFY